MRRRLAVLAVAGALVFSACSGNDGSSPTQPSFARQQGAGITGTCDPARAEQLINELFARGESRSSALSRLKQVVRTSSDGDMVGARNHALRLVDFALERYFEGRLTGGISTGTATKLAEMLTEVLCLAGLPPFNPAALGLDGAAVVIDPNSPPTTIVTGTGFAGALVETGTVNEPTLFTITRLPDSPGPLLTQFDQYPLFYEFHANGITFNVPVVVSTCLPATLNPPDIDRLRLAHNIAPFTMGSIEVLDPVPGVTFVDCTTAQLGAAQRSRLEELAHHGFQLLKSTLLPAPLYAARYFGTGGISGSVRTFSPFGAVDPIGTLTPNASFTRTPGFGGLVEVVPAVTLTTPTGRAMEGIPVTWTITAGGGTAGNGTVLTDAAGFASAGSWRFGFTNPQTLMATTTTPANTSIVGSPYQFNGLGH